TPPGQVSLTPPVPTNVWEPNTSYSLGNTVIDTNGNLETVTTAGTSSPVEPIWTLTCGGVTPDNGGSPPTLVWTMGPASLEQIVGTIVYFNATTSECTIDFQPLLNIGDVSSVGLAMPSDFAVGGSPILNAGVISVAWLPQPQNVFHAGPTSGSPATPTWRL